MGGIFSSCNEMDVSGKLIVIKGGGSGIGLGMANKSFSQDGAKVVITGRDESKLEAATKRHENVTPFVLDSSKDELRDAMSIFFPAASL